MNPLKSLRPVLTASLAMPLIYFGLVGTTHAETMPAPMPCELEVEKGASEILFDLQLVMNRKNALSSDEFPAIRSALDSLEQHGTSALSTSCFRQDPSQKRRYHLWLKEQGGEVVASAHRRLNATCTRRTRMFISNHKVRIDEAVRARHLAQAAQYANAMRNGLDDDAMINRCAATADEVHALRSEYLPAILNQAALPKVQEKMTRAYGSVRRSLDEVAEALQTRSRKPAPTELETAAGQDHLRQELGQCVAYGQALTELGATDDLELASADEQGVSRAKAAAFCETATQSLDATFTAILAHNEAYRAELLERWRRVSLKGWDMEQVFNERGRPQTESVLGGGAIVWGYRDGRTCLQVRFTPRGKRIGEAAAVACKDQVASSN